MNLQADTEIKQLSWQAGLQLAELVFLDDEADILKALLAETMLLMQNCEITRVHQLIRQLAQLNMVKANVAKDMILHQEHLKLYIDGRVINSINFLKTESERMLKEIQDLDKCFKHIKKKFYPLPTRAK